MFSRELHKLLVLPLLLLMLSACSTGWMGEDDEDAPLEGTRLSIMKPQTSTLKLAGDREAISIDVEGAINNQLWLQAGGNARNNLGNVTLSGTSADDIWRADIGADNSEGQFNLTTPKVALKAVFTMDADLVVRAFRMVDGEEVWETDVSIDDEDSDAVVNGGIALGDRRLFVATGHAEVLALNPATGRVLWRRKVSAPVRSDPIVYAKKVYIMTLDNQVYALDSKTGDELWTYQGLSEITGILGGGGLVADADVVVAPFSNGEIVAFRAETGRVLWIDSLANRRQILNRLSNIVDIRARPVIDDGVLYVVSHANRLGTFRLEDGQRLWAREVGSIQSPVISGDFMYLVDNAQTVICFGKDNGKALWSSQLPAFEDMEDKEGPIFWSGPILAGGRLVLTSSDGQVAFLNPVDGVVDQTLDLGSRFYVPAVAALDTLLVLDDDARLTALK